MKHRRPLGRGGPACYAPPHPITPLTYSSNSFALVFRLFYARCSAGKLLHLLIDRILLGEHTNIELEASNAWQLYRHDFILLEHVSATFCKANKHCDLVWTALPLSKMP